MLHTMCLTYSALFVSALHLATLVFRSVPPGVDSLAMVVYHGRPELCRTLFFSRTFFLHVWFNTVACPGHNKRPVKVIDYLRFLIIVLTSYHWQNRGTRKMLDQSHAHVVTAWKFWKRNPMPDVPILYTVVQSKPTKCHLQSTSTSSTKASAHKTYKQGSAAHRIHKWSSLMPHAASMH